MNKTIKTLLLSAVAVTVAMPAVAQGRSFKRGVSVENPTYAVDYEALSKGASWFYNWALNPPTDGGGAFVDYGMDFCPMTWNGNYSNATIGNVVDKYPDNIDYVLSFNEPNFNEQAHMTPAEAANDWKNKGFLEYARSKGLKVVSPAVNYGTLAGYTDPVVWLDEFFSYLPNGVDDVDYIACHFYMPSVDALKSAIDRLKKYGKPIWLTEFCYTATGLESGISGNSEEQFNYMVETFEYLEKDADIYRYAWFMARTGNTTWGPGINLLKAYPNQGTLTDLGRAFVELPTFDADYYHQVNTVIPAVQYIDKSGTTVMLSTDTEGEAALDLNALGDYYADDYVTYNVEVPTTGTYTFDFRMTARSGCKMTVYCDDAAVTSAFSVATGGLGTYKNITVSAELPAGKHKIKLMPNRTYNAFRIHEFKIKTSAGIDGVAVDGAVPFEVVGRSVVSEVPVQVYNLQGAEVGCDNLASGVYVVVYAGGSTKIAIP